MRGAGGFTFLSLALVYFGGEFFLGRTKDTVLDHSLGLVCLLSFFTHEPIYYIWTSSFRMRNVLLHAFVLLSSLPVRMAIFFEFGSSCHMDIFHSTSFFIPALPYKYVYQGRL